MLAKCLCQKHGCSQELTKLHFDQLVNRAWNPHPSQEFVAWWHTQPEFREHGINAVHARNTTFFAQRFKEAVQFGLATLPK